MKPIIFICGHRKAGTTMFSNLFDGHQQLAVYPIDLNILYGYFPVYTENNYDNSELIDRLNKVIFSDLAKVSFIADNIDLDLFKQNFFANLDADNYQNLNMVLYTLLSSYFETINKINDSLYYLVKEVCIEIYAMELSQLFPNSIFLHLIRDPRDNFSAIKSGLNIKYKMYGDTENSLLFSLVNRVQFGLKAGLKNQQAIGNDRYKIIKFEELTTSPENVLKDICEGLKIDFQDSLLTPTVFGKSTKGNNFDNEEKFKIDNRNVGRWKERITSDEVALIECLLECEMQEFGYKTETGYKDQLDSLNKYYKWLNYRHLYFDRFSNN